MMLWIEHFDDLVDWMFKRLRAMREWNEAALLEIENIERFTRSVYYDRTARISRKEPEIRREFDFDIPGWSKSKAGEPLGDHKLPMVLSFHRTELSAVEALKAWQSFGFHRTPGHTPPIHEAGRIYLGKLRRT